VLGGDIAAGTAAIFDHHGMPEPLSELEPHKTGDHVGDASGGERDLERDVLGWIALRGGGGWRETGDQKRRQRHERDWIFQHAIPLAGMLDLTAFVLRRSDSPKSPA